MRSWDGKTLVQLPNESADSVKFYWIQKIAENGWAAYDTDVTVKNNQFQLGKVDTRLNLGYTVTPYSHIGYAQFFPFPLSRKELCEP